VSDDLTLYDLANQVLDAGYNCTKQEWGDDLLKLAGKHSKSEAIKQDLHDKLTAALGSYVSDVKARREKTAHAKRLMNRAVSYSGRVMTPTISIRNAEGISQGVLWIDATPRQFIEAVQREQAIVDGPHDSNRVRWNLVRACLDDEHLLGLPTLKDVCVELGVDPDTLGLSELEAS
jgi:hypothetical protein